MIQRVQIQSAGDAWVVRIRLTKADLATLTFDQPLQEPVEGGPIIRLSITQESKPRVARDSDSRAQVLLPRDVVDAFESGRCRRVKMFNGAFPLSVTVAPVPGVGFFDWFDATHSLRW